MDITDKSKRITIALTQAELDDLIGQLRSGGSLRPGSPRQQRLLAKLRGFRPGLPATDPSGGQEQAEAACPLERDTPDDVSWLADWVHGRLHELTDGDELAVMWKQIHLTRVLLGRMHHWLGESDHHAAAITAFQAEALAAHVARYLEHILTCATAGPEDDEDDEDE